MAKNIVIFSDGTGQEGGKDCPSNVYKLFNMIENRTSRQLAFYDRGLGTGWRKITGNVCGRGMSKNIKECYQFIFENYEAGDRIYLFGFSRGAATVRSLSGFIHMFGLLPKSRPELIKKAYRIYRIRNTEKRDHKAEGFRAKHHSMWCKITFLGVWDTVAALGVPFKLSNFLIDKIPLFQHRFHDFSLSPSVENAYHALAIDEQRRIFHPLLWNPQIADYQTMKQVWFCGVHTDVGGGYPEHGISDIPLLWMKQRAIEHGLLLYPKHTVNTEQNIDGIIHDSRKGPLAKLVYRKKTRCWDSNKRGLPTTHGSVLQRTLDTNNNDSGYKPWILKQEYDVEPWDQEVPTGIKKG